MAPALNKLRDDGYPPEDIIESVTKGLDGLDVSPEQAVVVSSLLDCCDP